MGQSSQSSRWLAAVLNQRAIPFYMQVKKSGNTGLTGVRDFLRRSLAEKIVTLRAADRGVRSTLSAPAGRQQCAWCATSRAIARRVG